MVKHYIFDLFGTLVKTLEPPGMIKKLFPEIDYSSLRLFLRKDYGSIENCLTEIEKTYSICIGATREKSILNKLHQGLDDLTLYPQAKIVLSALRMHSRIGLLSNIDSLMDSVIDRLDLSKHFDVITLSHQVGVLKPDEEIYQRCIDDLDVEPSSIIMIGDDLEKDVRKPIALGMRGLLFDPENRLPYYKQRIVSLKDILSYEF